MKRGRYSKYEMQFIKDNASTMTYISIADEIGRDPEAVRGIIEGLGLEINLAKGATKAAPSLKSRDFWPLIREQFSAAEQLYIESQWEKIYKQFNEDVTPTEEMQIIDTIKLDVLMHRNLIDKEHTRRDMDELRSEAASIKKKKGEDKDPTDMIRLNNIASLIQALTAASQNGMKEYQSLQNEKNKILKDMKSTRDQRYDKIQASDEKIQMWMAELITNHEKREELGMHLEKVRMACLDEEVRLAAWHRYEDGKVDQPLLSPSTCKDGHELA